MLHYDPKEPVEITITIKSGERTVTLAGLRALGFSIETKHADVGFFDSPMDIVSHRTPQRVGVIAESPLINEETGVLYTMTVDPPLAPGEEF